MVQRNNEIVTRSCLGDPGRWSRPEPTLADGSSERAGVRRTGPLHRDPPGGGALSPEGAFQDRATSARTTGRYDTAVAGFHRCGASKNRSNSSPTVNRAPALAKSTRVTP